MQHVGWQARTAEVLDTLAPELSARLASTMTTLALPGPIDASEGDENRTAGDVGFGWLTPFLKA